MISQKVTDNQSESLLGSHSCKAYFLLKRSRKLLLLQLKEWGAIRPSFAQKKEWGAIRKNFLLLRSCPY